MNGQNGRFDSGPGIFMVGAGKLNVVELAEASLMRIGKIKCMSTRNAFKGDADAAQKG